MSSSSTSKRDPRLDGLVAELHSLAKDIPHGTRVNGLLIGNYPGFNYTSFSQVRGNMIIVTLDIDMSGKDVWWRSPFVEDDKVPFVEKAISILKEV